MTRFRKRLLYGIGLLLLILAGLFFWAYRGTRTTLLRAEAFQFRRMLVSQLGEDGAYRFFYVSNRSLEPGDGPFQERFGRDRQEDLELGFFDTLIVPSLGLGMLLNANDWFRDEEIQIRDVQRLQKPAFVAQVRLVVRASPHRLQPKTRWCSTGQALANSPQPMATRSSSAAVAKSSSFP